MVAVARAVLIVRMNPPEVDVPEDIAGHPSQMSDTPGSNIRIEQTFGLDCVHRYDA